MNIKKTITIIIIVAVLFTIAILIFININFFRETSLILPEAKEKPAAEEKSQPAYAIPSNAIPEGQMIEYTVNRKEERQKTLKERELEAKCIRDINRAEALARQKELEPSLMHAETQGTTPSLPKKDTKSPSEEEMKAMEKNGIISY